MLFGGGQNESFEDCWAHRSFSYKFYFLSTLAIFLISFITPLCFFLVDIPLLTIGSLNLWRIFFCFWGNIPSLFAIINILFAFLWMISILDVTNIDM